MSFTLGCGDNLDGEDRQGGDATVNDRTALAFTHAFPTLDPDQAETALLGHGPFAFQWEPPQLGPLFNNDSCAGCHFNNGRGLSQIAPGFFGSQALIRVSQDTGAPGAPGGPIPVPGLGLQLQDHATFGLPEVIATLAWDESSTALGDGEVVMLRKPHLTVTLANNDPFPPGVHQSYRQAPPLIGLGLLEAVSDDTLQALADPDDADGDGISGRVNMAFDNGSQTTKLGRFGHKASVPRLVEQAAGAFANDMGLTNKLFLDPDGVTRDVNDDQLDQVGFFVSTIAVPAAAPRDSAATQGRALFDEFHCSGCHLVTLVTGEGQIPQLTRQRIHPYTDLLLHDMGDGLADNRTDFLASGSEWRTPPLWGLGLVQLVAPDATFLHDGRARSVTEAILWHGGEATAASDAFRAANRADREALLAFLGTL